MPNKNTFSIKPIDVLIKKYVVSGNWLDPYANNNNLKNNIPNANIITNDLNPDCDTMYHLKAIDFLRKCKDNWADGVLYDPPFSVRQVSECYKQFGYEVTQEDTRSDFYTKDKKEVARIVKQGGIVMSFGWNTIGIGKTNGFEIIEILLVCHGGIHNDTICTVERKL
jgi:spermidine/putrescine-binding protein